MHQRSSKHPGRADPRWLAAYRKLAVPILRKLWPVSFEGAGNLPDHNGYLLVGNHSGLGVVESVAFTEAWLTHVGEHRPLAAMAHSALMRAPWFGQLLRSVGAVEATREGAAWARSSGAAVLLFPGGDHEAMRPMWRARRVDFGNHRGWIRLARELGLTVVPLAITGSHVTVPNLGASRRLAWLSGIRFAGLHRIPFPVLSIAAAVASLRLTRRRSLATRIGTGVAAYAVAVLVPIVPAKIGYHVLPPLTEAELAMDDDQVYERVTRSIEAVLRRGGLG